MIRNYYTEILPVSTKWWSGRAKEEDVQALDELLNSRYAEGWEAISVNYVMTYGQIESQFVITFRKREY